MKNESLKEFKFYTPLGCLIVVANLCAAITGDRMLSINLGVCHANILYGIIPFCISFMLIDIFTNQYGFNNAKKLIMTVLICKVFVLLILYIGLNSIVFKSNQQDFYYQIEIYTIIRAIYSGLIAIFIAFYINCTIFSRILKKFNGKHLWVRCIVATSTGEFIYSVISNSIFLIGKMNLISIVVLTFNNYSFKFLFEILTMPITYLMTYFLLKFETKTPIKYININLN